MATTKSKPTKPSEVNDRRSKAPVKTIAKERSSTTEQTDHEVRKMLSLSSIMLGLVIFLAISNLVLAWYAVGRKVEVIAVTESGNLTHPIPVDQAFVTESRVLSFVDECLRSSFSHDFEIFRKTFNQALPCYTSGGGKELTKAIDPLLQDIKTRRLVMSVSNETPTIVRGPRLVGGVATWDVQVVMTMYFSGTRERFPSQQRLASVSVVRVPIEEDPRGIGINAIQLSPYVKQ